jgi:lysophospholipase L1-like esterase
VLVVGDSTAVGTGAGDAALSVPGRLASDYPGVVLENRAQDGARTAAAVDQMRDAASHSYALVLVLVGGNDVLQLTPTAALHKAISEVLQEAAGLGEHVVLMTVGDVGSAPAVPWPISMLLSRRAAKLRSIFAEEAERRGVSYLDMYVPDGRRDPFARDPGTFYARDGLHPSAAGYGLWYQHLEREAPLQRWLSAP